MKFLILISLALFSYQFSFAQYPGDSLDVQINKKNNKVEVQQDNSKKIGDKNVQPLNKGKRKMDVFIDKDGDGICDQRANGMGFDKMRKRYRTGKQGGGKGGGQGNGNNGSEGKGN
jgi:hypothetical protein